MNKKIRPIAIYLPQYHPIPENDQWWGKGFTEWTNVTKAKPQYPGHYQPHLPADLGFYDLRLAETRQAQADLAKEHGIYGFCYYHYWFNGKRLLERPAEEMLKTGQPDFPFMLCWANENWSRRWDGSEHVLLMKQEYSEADAEAQCRALFPYFADTRYIKVDNKPVFVIYKPNLIPHIKEYIQAFRNEAQRNNIDIYICAMELFEPIDSRIRENCFDALIEFQPHSKAMLAFMKLSIETKLYGSLARKIKTNLFTRLVSSSYQSRKATEAKMKIDYNSYVDFVLMNYEFPDDHKRYPGITPMWDNTARRGKEAFMLKNSQPQKYGEWLHFLNANFKPYAKDENFLFINAWNEWAEGNHLEPCQKWGRAYLETTRDILSI